jgi:Fe-S cluster biogenesis protein NfuA
MGQNYSVIYEATPNPNSMRFLVGQQIANETVQFDSPTQSARSPIAQKLFGFPWAQAIMVGPQFITVTKQSWVDWQVIADPLASLIEEHLERGEGILLDAKDFEAPEEEHVHGDGCGHDHGHSHADANQIVAGDSEDIQVIKKILLNDVRPAVQMDGGDIVFHKYESGRLFVKLKGACSGCPSSMITLKDGIEVRMKEALPDLIEVISI